MLYQLKLQQSRQMGASQICQPPQAQQANNNELVKSATCFPNICNRVQAGQNTRADQKIVPIEFSEIQIQSVKKDNHQQQQNQQKEEGEEVGKEGNVEIIYNNFKYCPVEEKASEEENANVVVVNRKQQGKLQVIEEPASFQPVSVPFSVIKLIIRPEILKQIKKIQMDFEKIHQNPQSQTFSSWKLQAKGFYSNRISDGTCIIITQNQFYQGNINKNQLIPENKGILINAVGIYRGSFKNGKANGKGNFTSSNGKRKYEGAWTHGNLTKGKVQSQQFKYDGQFENNVPHGKGTLEIFKNKVKYVGCFQNGVFEDQDGFYSCQMYEYKGGFRQGKKNGYGQLRIKYETIKKSGIHQVKGNKILKGNWQDDQFKSQVSIK